MGDDEFTGDFRVDAEQISVDRRFPCLPRTLNIVVPWADLCGASLAASPLDYFGTRIDFHPNSIVVAGSEQRAVVELLHWITRAITVANARYDRAFMADVAALLLELTGEERAWTPEIMQLRRQAHGLLTVSRRLICPITPILECLMLKSASTDDVSATMRKLRPQPVSRATVGKAKRANEARLRSLPLSAALALGAAADIALFGSASEHFQDARSLRSERSEVMTPHKSEVLNRQTHRRNDVDRIFARRFDCSRS